MGRHMLVLSASRRALFEAVGRAVPLRATTRARSARCCPAAVSTWRSGPRREARTLAARFRHDSTANAPQASRVQASRVQPPSDTSTACLGPRTAGLGEAERHPRPDGGSSATTTAGGGEAWRGRQGHPRPAAVPPATPQERRKREPVEQRTVSKGVKGSVAGEALGWTIAEDADAKRLHARGEACSGRQGHPPPDAVPPAIPKGRRKRDPVGQRTIPKGVKGFIAGEALGWTTAEDADAKRLSYKVLSEEVLRQMAFDMFPELRPKDAPSSSAEADFVKPEENPQEPEDEAKSAEKRKAAETQSWQTRRKERFLEFGAQGKSYESGGDVSQDTIQSIYKLRENNPQQWTSAKLALLYRLKRPVVERILRSKPNPSRARFITEENIRRANEGKPSVEEEMAKKERERRAQRNQMFEKLRHLGRRGTEGGKAEVRGAGRDRIEANPRWAGRNNAARVEVSRSSPAGRSRKVKKENGVSLSVRSGKTAGATKTAFPGRSRDHGS